MQATARTDKYSLAALWVGLIAKYYAPINSNIPLVRGIRRSLIVIGSITEVKRRRARFIIGWVTAW